MLGLTAAKTYRCTVTATNKIGTGPASARSVAVVVRPVPPGVPPAPKVKAGTRSATVTFTKPTHDGGRRLDVSVVCTSKNGGSSRTTQSTKSPVVVVGLAAAATYRCTVAAGNRIGIGPRPCRRRPVVVRPTAPSVPSVKSVRPEWHGLAVAFDKPLHDGGAPITNYRARASRPRAGSVAARRVQLTDPRERAHSGVKYTCTVAASNNIKRGPASKPSKTAIPLPQ